MEKWRGLHHNTEHLYSDVNGSSRNLLRRGKGRGQGRGRGKVTREPGAGAGNRLY